MKKYDLKDVEKALGFELTALQKQVITASMDEFLKMVAPEGRKNFTTSAAVLRLLLSEGDTIDLLKFSPGNLHDGTAAAEKNFFDVSSCAGYSGDYDNKKRYYMFCETVMDFYNRLWCAGIDPRPVTFINRNKKQNYLYEVKFDTSGLTRLENIIDRLIEKTEKLQKNILEIINE